MINAYTDTFMGAMISISCVINMADEIGKVKTNKGYMPYHAPLQRYILVIE